jgi:ribonuclease J
VNRSSRSEDELVFLPLGGAGEIGMNLNLYGYGPPTRRNWIIADLGVTFADPSTPGVDVIMPNPAFIAERRHELLGIILTHGHEDHLGAIAHLWPRLECPVYATPFTAALVRGKLAEAGLGDEVAVHEIPLGGRVCLGPFDIEFVTTTHSILEPNALALHTPLGTVLHSGDFKIDPDPLIGETVDEARLREIGAKGCLALVCDSTNVFVEGASGSEALVRTNLISLIKSRTGRVAVTTFASNVVRLQSVALAAQAAGRHLVLVGHAMHKMVMAARASGYLSDFPPLIPEEDAGYLPPDKVLYLCTGSQGEGRAALARIADNSHPNVVLEKGDTVVFSSRVIPGNEITIFRLQNMLVAREIEVVTEKDHFVHVSGHPCRDELGAMYRWLRPRIALPVHGELRHLAEHVRLAHSLQIPEAIVAPNGSMVRLAPGPAEIIDNVPVGRLYLDGDILVEGETLLAARKRLAFAGHLSIFLIVDGEGRLKGDPTLILAGVPEANAEGIDMRAQLSDAVGEGLTRLLPTDRRDDRKIAEIARRSARLYLKNFWGKKVPVDVAVHRLPAASENA